MRIGEEEGRPRARGRRGARRKWRCHSCGHREATEATGFCIPACPGGGGRSRGLSGFGAGEEEQGCKLSKGTTLLERGDIFRGKSDLVHKTVNTVVDVFDLVFGVF